MASFDLVTSRSDKSVSSVNWVAVGKIRSQEPKGEVKLGILLEVATFGPPQ